MILRTVITRAVGDNGQFIEEVLAGLTLSEAIDRCDDRPAAVHAKYQRAFGHKPGDVKSVHLPYILEDDEHEDQ